MTTVVVDTWEKMSSGEVRPQRRWWVGDHVPEACSSLMSRLGWGLVMEPSQTRGILKAD